MRDAIDVSDSTLSRHLDQLEHVGYVTSHKGVMTARPRTWLSLTSAGRAACAQQLAALRAVAMGG